MTYGAWLLLNRSYTQKKPVTQIQQSLCVQNLTEALTKSSLEFRIVRFFNE